MSLTTDQVLALAPDAASAKSATGLASPSHWPLLGQNENAIWGECKGSGSKPYQTQIDRSGPAFRCSCPSRKFPCKHGLALLLLNTQTAAAFTANEMPGWVSEWLASREARSSKQEEKARAATAEPSASQQKNAEKREARRQERAQAGLHEIQLWLDDQARQGLAAMAAQGQEQLRILANRMVDAQLPGLLPLIRRMTAVLGQNQLQTPWPAQMLPLMGRLQLLIEAMQHQAALSTTQQEDLQTALGMTLTRDDVLRSGERISDCWQVLGIHIREDEKLWERRVWLYGRSSGQSAMLLDFSHGGARFNETHIVGQQQAMTLAFYPGAQTLRALTVAVDSSPELAPVPEFGSLEQALQSRAQALSKNPWQPIHAFGLQAATPVLHADCWWLFTADGQALPMAVSQEEGWQLLALCGGHEAAIFGEWHENQLRPLTVWQTRLTWTRPGAAL